MGILDLFKLDGKTALVTGCRRGIGRGFAQALAEAGADIVGVSATLEEDSAIEGDVRERGRDFKGYACDFADRAALGAFVADVKRDVGPIDILVNNAGTIMRAPVEERGGGKIVFTASVLTFQGGITVPGYAAAKGGIGQLTMALSNEWASKGVNVNAIAPGYIATDNNQALRDDPVRNEQLLVRIPANRWGAPDDLKGAVVWLCSAASDYVHGSVVLVDGGWMGR
jgi:2-deoxy-D-gluconate 3-dehydrogenase